jgi:hypothetical protein
MVRAKRVLMIFIIVRDRLVRDQAFKALDIFVKKLETHAATMVYFYVLFPGLLP